MAAELVSTTVSAILLWAFLAAITAPLESLGWWAGWYGERRGRNPQPHEGATVAMSDAAARPPKPAIYIVYLTGIGGIEPLRRPHIETSFLHALAARLPNARIVDDIFPYSPANEALTGNRIFAWFWRRTIKYRSVGGMARLIGYLPNIRNLFQVVVSADRRYGPVYNFACAQLILEGLLRHGFERGETTPVLLLGYSGGGQMAVGAVEHLHSRVDAPISIVSLAGVLCAAPGLDAVQHVYHLYASRDVVEKIGVAIFPGRWGVMQNSTWNRLKQEGRLTLRNMGPLVHDQKGSYLDAESYFETGESYLTRTAETIAAFVQREAAAEN